MRRDVEFNFRETRGRLSFHGVPFIAVCSLIAPPSVGRSIQHGEQSILSKPEGIVIASRLVHTPSSPRRPSMDGNNTNYIIF